jgi:soluble lytic murein transglycosylase
MIALMLFFISASVAAEEADDRTRFQQAWKAAATGDRDTFDRLRPGLQAYILYPYLQYEDYRHRRSSTPADEMTSFLDGHADWAFTAGLRNAWLYSLGSQRRWETLAQVAGEVRETRLRCQLAHARIELGDTDELLAEVQNLWAAPHSQPDECDPAFEWLARNDGITRALAWDRIRRAMGADNWRLTRYLERYVPEGERIWVQRWRDQARARYRKVDEAAQWVDGDQSRVIAAASLKKLARADADHAMRAYRKLEGHFGWSELDRADILREIGLYAAVDLSDDALAFMATLPPASLDGQLLEWWARAAIAAQDWVLLEQVTGRMPQELADDAQWRYWRAQALRETGDPAASLAELERLSTRTTYYGFLAADELDLPYTICPDETPGQAEAARVRATPRFARALELRAVGLDDWAVREWDLAQRSLAPEELRAVAALAWEEAWYDRAIFALGNSGDLRLYEWRFPTPWADVVAREAAKQQLDQSLVFGVMRSESALAERAQSAAGALGLMQVMPGTARQMSRRHGLAYSGSAQLRQAEPNITFGTTYMRELLDRFEQNPALAAGAYNAGPEAVERWLRDRPRYDTLSWIETIPYYETRDYIPRVLAFTVIYDWRLGNPVKRVSSRLPSLGANAPVTDRTAGIVCPVPAMEAP